MKQPTITLTLVLILTLAANANAEDCALSTDLVYRANELFNHKAPLAQQIDVLTQAVEVCPGNAYAHNNLANLLGEQQQFSKAIEHYHQALAIKPQFPEAWFGLGDTYQTNKQLPQAIEAYLHACTQDADAKARVTALLKDKQFAAANEGAVLDRETITLLFDKKRLEEIKQLTIACGLPTNRTIMEPTVVLRNLEFATGKANLDDSPTNQRQISELSAALNALPAEQKISVAGHSDNKPFANVSAAVSEQRNLELSQARAESIRAALTKQGIAEDRISAHGYGSSKPISTTDLSRNRRVEINVE